MKIVKLDEEQTRVTMEAMRSFAEVFDQLPASPDTKWNALTFLLVAAIQADRKCTDVEAVRYVVDFLTQYAAALEAEQAQEKTDA